MNAGDWATHRSTLEPCRIVDRQELWGSVSFLVFAPASGRTFRAGGGTSEEETLWKILWQDLGGRADAAFYVQQRPNNDQADSDTDGVGRDGIGDACDPCPSVKTWVFTDRTAQYEYGVRKAVIKETAPDHYTFAMNGKDASLSGTLGAGNVMSSRRAGVLTAALQESSRNRSVARRAGWAAVQRSAPEHEDQGESVTSRARSSAAGSRSCPRRSRTSWRRA